ncbi:MAG: hypothetical protein MZW92_60595 [Comamonadaceae bacterium]|nr:hypothetical protein [Comamonadaceae bacterium]
MAPALLFSKLARVNIPPGYLHIKHDRIPYYIPECYIWANHTSQITKTGMTVFLKMHGRKLYQYAIEKVPQTIKECLEKSNIHISEIKALIHQANGKMDDAILKRLFSLYDIVDVPEKHNADDNFMVGKLICCDYPDFIGSYFKDNLKPQK